MVPNWQLHLRTPYQLRNFWQTFFEDQMAKKAKVVASRITMSWSISAVLFVWSDHLLHNRGSWKGILPRSISEPIASLVQRRKRRCVIFAIGAHPIMVTTSILILKFNAEKRGNWDRIYSLGISSAYALSLSMINCRPSPGPNELDAKVVGNSLHLVLLREVLTENIIAIDFIGSLSCISHFLQNP